MRVKVFGFLDFASFQISLTFGILSLKMLFKCSYFLYFLGILTSFGGVESTVKMSFHGQLRNDILTPWGLKSDLRISKILDMNNFFLRTQTKTSGI